VGTEVGAVVEVGGTGVGVGLAVLVGTGVGVLVGVGIGVDVLVGKGVGVADGGTGVDVAVGVVVGTGVLVGAGLTVTVAERVEPTCTPPIIHNAVTVTGDPTVPTPLTTVE